MEQIEPQVEDKKTIRKKFVAERSNRIFKWNPSKEWIDNQVNNYDTLPFKKTIRGEAILFIFILQLLTILVGFLAIFFPEQIPFTFADTLLGFIIFAPFLWFAYRGKMWAYWPLIILTIVDRVGYLFLYSSGAVTSLFFGYYMVNSLWYARKIEKERKNRGLEKLVPSGVEVKKKKLRLGLIIPVWFILLLATIFTAFYEEQKKMDDLAQAPTIEQYAERINPNDPSCTGESNEFYNLGFGIEHVYTGEIQKGMPVEVVLSCDHKKFTISGAVEQVIRSVDITEPGEEELELTDTSGGSLVVDIVDDYNFDGYKDLSSIMSNGSGVTGIDGYFIFLYDKNTNKFILNRELSSLYNVVPEYYQKHIQEIFVCSIPDNDDEDWQTSINLYEWINGELVLIKEGDDCQ